MLSYCIVKEKSIKIYNYFINMTEEDINQEIRLKKIDGINNYFLKK